MVTATCGLEASWGDGKLDPSEECDPDDPDIQATCTSNCTKIIFR
jgi:hypothetical protein